MRPSRSPARRSSARPLRLAVVAASQVSAAASTVVRAKTVLVSVTCANIIRPGTAIRTAAAAAVSAGLTTGSNAGPRPDLTRTTSPLTTAVTTVNTAMKSIRLTGISW